MIGLVNDSTTSPEMEFDRLLEESPGEVEPFFEITRNLKKGGEKEKPRAMLQKLAATQKELGLSPARLDTLLEIARAFPNRAASSEEMAAALRDAYGDHPCLEDLITHYFKPRVPGPEAVEKVRRWLVFRPGAVFYFAGHGSGKVTELKPAIDAVRMEFEGGERLSLPPGAAARNLVPLAEGDFRRQRLEDREGLAERSLADPADALRHLLTSVGRPMTASEIKEEFAKVIPPARWTAFWSAARRSPQLLLSGKGKDAGYAWMESAEAARDSIRDEFDAASPARRLDLARKHASRKKLSERFVQGLAEAAEQVAETEPSTALEILLFLESAFPETRPPRTPGQILTGPGAAAVAAGVREPAARIRAYELLRETAGPSWPALFMELFRTEEDSRALAALDEALKENAPSDRSGLVAGILRSPRTAPRAFLWLLGRRDEDPDVESRMDVRLLSAILDAVRLPEFSSSRARLKALFDRGGLALSLVEHIPDVEEARRLRAAAERAAGLESFRRDDFKQALSRKFPELAGARVQPLYATADSIEKKRAELEHLLTVELPRNGKAIQEAAALGDLRENFEYHAARARQEFLSARVATLRLDLGRARPLQAESIEPSEVRVGTRVRLRSGEKSRELVILGPWESDPDQSVYSYESDFAKALLGKKPGERAALEGAQWEIERIERWTGSFS
jgi:transcription elongation GreA/GreB family factor